jgi:hypothetical protein
VPRPFLSTGPVSLRILIAEDPLITTFLRTILERHGHQVMTGEPMRNRGMQPQLVITNRPEDFLPFAGTLPMLYIAASPDPAMALRFSNCRVLCKPFRNADLLEAVDELAQSVLP